MTQQDESKTLDLESGASEDKTKKTNTVKMMAIAAVIFFIGIGIFALQKDNQEDLPKDQPKELAEPEVVIQEQDNRAIQLQAEIDGLLERLKKVRQQMQGNRQNWQKETQSLTTQLQTASDGGLELSKALMDSEKQAGHWQAVEVLADKVVYESNSYTQVQGQLSNAKQLIHDENIQAAVDILTPIKTSLITMLSQAENTEAVVAEGNAVREARNNWQMLVAQQSWDQLPPALKIEKKYQNTYQDENEGHLAAALIGYSALLKDYGSLQHAGETLIATQMPLENAKGGWEAFANKYGLNDIPLAKTLSKDYTQYQQTISAGELLVASEKAVSLEKSYSDLLAGGQNISQYRDKALKAKKDWDAYASEQKLTVIPQHEQWANEMAGAEVDLKAGKLPKAGAAYKQLAENYTVILKNAGLAIGSLTRALMAELDWKAFASGNKLRISRAIAAEANLKATAPVMRKGQFEQANEMLIAVALTYEELLSGAEQALSALQSATTAKKDCESLEVAIKKRFCSKANKQYGITLAIWKKGEFGVATTQFNELVAEYRRLFVANGQSKFTVAGVDITLQTIPAGSFQMKSYKINDKNPTNLVNVETFKVMAKEVTFAQYDAYAKTVGSKLPYDEGWGRGDHPVINVNWNDAQGFAKWLSRQTGKKFRLPTEAEWEYAARSSTTTKYSWGNSIDCSKAQYNGGKNSSCYYKSDGEHKGSALVGSFSPNAWGLYDMSGNVWEWTKNCMNENDQSAPKNVMSMADRTCTNRIIRGGSWSSFPDIVNSTARDWNEETMRTHIDGFRLVQEFNL